MKNIHKIKENIYITNDEEIKKGDYFINKHGEISKCVKSFLELWLQTKGKEDTKKIVLTTDQDLIKDGIQAINDKFLEWFVKNPSCEFVEVRKEKYSERFDNDKSPIGNPDTWGNRWLIIIPKEEQKKILIDIMKSDEELGLYDDIKANRIELVCKDCSDSLEDCTCIITTVDFPKQEPKKVLTEEDIFNQKDIDAVTDYINKEQQKQHLIDMMESDEELELYDESREIKLKDVFNDEKKENIKKFIDEINNPSEPNDKLKQAFEKYSEYLEDYENKNTYEHGFKDGAKCQQEIMYSEEEVIAFGEFIFKHSLLTHTRGVKSLFEQFKKK